MKTKFNIYAVAIAALIFGGCSSSMQLSRAPGQSTDDVYYTAGANEQVAAQPAENTPLKRGSDSELGLAELEKKYGEILANDTTGNVDTVIYKSQSKENPYERVLSDSYQESYERRLRGRYNGYYGIGGVYSDDYWYASAYDPTFYNVIVMGSDIWVEPWYISSMFGWPNYGFGFGYSWPYSGFGYSPWGYGYASWNWGYPYSPFYYHGGYWGMNSYAWGYNNGYWDGYYWGNNYNNNYYQHGNYGIRPNVGGPVVAGGTRPGGSTTAGINDTHRQLGDRQVVLSNNTQDPTVISSRPNKANNSQEITRKPNVVTRPSRESLNINPTRIVTNNREITRTEPTRQSYNPSYTKPKPANSSEFNRPIGGTYPASESVRIEGGNSRKPKIEAPRGSRTPQSGRTYSPPSGSSNTPSGLGNSRSNSGGRTSRGSGSSSSSGSSVSSGSSSSGSSSSGSRSSSGGSSSSSSGRKR